MAKVSVTYNPPKGDDKIVEFRGVEFIGGQPADLDAETDADTIEKLRNHPNFEVSGGTESPTRAKSRQQENAERTTTPVDTAGPKPMHIADKKTNK